MFIIKMDGSYEHVLIYLSSGCHMDVYLVN